MSDDVRLLLQQETKLTPSVACKIVEKMAKRRRREFPTLTIINTTKIQRMQGRPPKKGLSLERTRHYLWCRHQQKLSSVPCVGAARSFFCNDEQIHHHSRISLFHRPAAPTMQQQQHQLPSLLAMPSQKRLTYWSYISTRSMKRGWSSNELDSAGARFRQRGQCYQT